MCDLKNISSQDQPQSPSSFPLVTFLKNIFVLNLKILRDNELIKMDHTNIYYSIFQKQKTINLLSNLSYYFLNWKCIN